MNQFRIWMNNPNVHLWSALILGVVQAVPVLAPFAGILQSIALTLTATGALLPESGSLHQVDYSHIADEIAKAIRPAVEQVQGRT